MAVERKPRLLIVDDEPHIREMLTRHLIMAGYEVIADPANGEEALEILSKKRFEVVITDIMMPRMDGVELLRHIKKEYPMVQVIIITGYVNMENLLAAMRHGASACIFKPIEDMAELEEAVAKAVDHLAQWQQKLKFLLGMKPGQGAT
ncbi:MAG: response regulator [Thermodesulfobacteriota bacterium]|nr:response regulator [Thermodesulfobacteriota bacterium]